MITLKRHDAADPFKTGSPPMPSLTWWRFAPNSYGHAYCCCSKGHVTLLSKKNHTVSASGVVSPSYVCPVDGCTFHEFVTLEGWT